MKHNFYLWILMLSVANLFSCTSSEKLATEEAEQMRLPGMPTHFGQTAIAESDGLIGVDPAPGLFSSYLLDSIRVVVDDPYSMEEKSDPNTRLIIYTLPNGNSIEWTMGKQKNETDDWHFNIQYLDAQTNWLRAHTDEKYILAYLEAPKLSWPAWRRSQEGFGLMIDQVIDSLRMMYPHAQVILNSHSGGGSFINGFIETHEVIPDWISRIGFIDSDYGYNSAIGQKLKTWLDSEKNHILCVFAYNDSIALYKGKPFVSPTGGTWYRSKMMKNDLSQTRVFTQSELPENITQYKSDDGQILFLLKGNPQRSIFHTEQVELNGFIHSILFGTRYEDAGYEYFGEPCYEVYIRTQTPGIQSVTNE